MLHNYEIISIKLLNLVLTNGLIIPRSLIFEYGLTEMVNKSLERLINKFHYATIKKNVNLLFNKVIENKI